MILVILTTGLLLACGVGDSRPVKVAEVIFPMFAECQPEIEHLQKLLRAGERHGDITIEKFTFPIESHRSLIGVARARFAGDHLLEVTPEEYLQSSVASVLQSCMPNLGERIEVEGLGERMRRTMPSGVYSSTRRFYAEVEGDGIGIFFNDGTYNYVMRNQ